MISLYWTFLPALILILSLLFPSPCLAGEYVVTNVTDGDTVWVSRENDRFKVRLVGIDAPELLHLKNVPSQDFSKKSRQQLASQVLNRVVEVHSFGFENQMYGSGEKRMLGEIFLNGRNINIEMIQAGLAEVYRGKPASGQDIGPYWKAEEEARKAGKGMWVQGNKYVSPREWRRTH